MSIKDVDTHKLSYHPKRVSNWVESGICSPLHAEIGVTNRCNHKCSFCTLDWITHGKSDIDKDVMNHTLITMAKMGVKSIYFAGEGEPTLHKNIAEFINTAKKCEMSSSMSTNGSALTSKLSDKIAEPLSWIRFSLDAGSSGTYSKIHKVKSSEYLKVLRNIEYLANLKHKKNYKINIGVQAILMPENMSELEGLANLIKGLGVDNFQIKPCHNHPKSSHTPEFYEFSRDEFKKRISSLDDDKFTTIVRVKSMERLEQERSYKICHGFHFYALIDSKGDVVPCNVFYNQKDFIFGNINNEDFYSIWHSDKRANIIKKITKLKFSKCGNYRCRFDVMNRYLERVINPEENDEFI